MSTGDYGPAPYVAKEPGPLEKIIRNNPDVLLTPHLALRRLEAIVKEARLHPDAKIAGAREKTAEECFLRLWNLVLKGA